MRDDDRECGGDMALRGSVLLPAVSFGFALLVGWWCLSGAAYAQASPPDGDEVPVLVAELETADLVLELPAIAEPAPAPVEPIVGSAEPIVEALTPVAVVVEVVAEVVPAPLPTSPEELIPPISIPPPSDVPTPPAPPAPLPAPVDSGPPSILSATTEPSAAVTLGPGAGDVAPFDAVTADDADLRSTGPANVGWSGRPHMRHQAALPAVKASTDDSAALAPPDPSDDRSQWPWQMSAHQHAGPMPAGAPDVIDRGPLISAALAGTPGAAGPLAVQVTPVRVMPISGDAARPPFTPD